MQTWGIKSKIQPRGPYSAPDTTCCMWTPLHVLTFLIILHQRGIHLQHNAKLAILTAKGNRGGFVPPSAVIFPPLASLLRGDTGSGSCVSRVLPLLLQRNQGSFLSTCLPVAADAGTIHRHFLYYSGRKWLAEEAGEVQHPRGSDTTNDLPRWEKKFGAIHCCLIHQ